VRDGWNLILHSLRRVRTLVFVMSVLLAGFQVLLVLVAGSIERSGGFEQLSAIIPDFVRQLMGPSFIGLMSYGGIISIGYFHIAVMGSLVGLIIALATEPASEIETRFIDLILSRPLARSWIITRSVAVLIVCTLVVLAMMMTGTWAGLYLLAPEGAAWPTPALISKLAINLGLLMVAWGGVALMISAASRRRSVAGSLTGLLALSTFLLDYVARAWEPAHTVAWLSPFRYYSPVDIVMGFEVPPYNLWVLAGVAFAGFVSAYLLFSRRDI
jgi:ABC-2 type transport system permease protein